MSTDELTARQSEVLVYIADFIRDIGYPPSTREIGDAMGISSPNAITGHLRALRRKGYIEYPEEQRQRARAIRLVRRQGECCPICGRRDQ